MNCKIVKIKELFDIDNNISKKLNKNLEKNITVSDFHDHINDINNSTGLTH